MRKFLLSLLLCVCIPFAGGAMEPVELLDSLPLDQLFPVVVILQDGSDTEAPERILLIVIHTESGKAMKATISPVLFPLGEMDTAAENSIQRLLSSMEEKLQIPLEKYVSIGMEALGSLESGEAKDKGVLELISIGFSLLGSTQTNLSAGQTLNTFKTAFSEKDSGIEIELTGDSEADWDVIRGTLYEAISQLVP